MKPLERAQELLSWGWAVVPVPHGEKRPNVPWKPFQSQMPTDADLAQWFSYETGLGVVCGHVSGNLVCLDFDAPGAYEHWAKANPDRALALPTARSGRGCHVFLRTPERTPSRALFLPGFSGKAGDVISDGKLVVLPPTRHPSGYVREWLHEPRREIPCMALEAAGVVSVEASTGERLSGPLLPERIPEGDRHNTLTRLAALLAKRGVHYALGRRLLSAVNANFCEVPLPEYEVQKIADWAGNLAASHPSLKEEGWDDGLVGFESVIPSQVPIGNDDPMDEGRPYGHLFRSLPDYLASEGVKEQSWVVEGLLPESYLVVLGGTSKAGKSCFTTALGMAVASGEPFLGMPTQQGAVLWCAYEESETERALSLRSFPTQPGAFYITHEKLHIDSPEGLAALRWWIRRTGAKLLVVDPLYGANTADTLSDGRKAREVLAGLKELCRETRACAVVIHHFTKNVSAGLTRERFADSNQILATASMDLLMDATERPDGSRELRLVGRGRGSFANQTWIVRSNGIADFVLVASGTDSKVDSEAKDEELLSVLRDAADGMTAEELAERTGCHLKTLRNRLTALAKGGKVETIGKRSNASVYVAVDAEQVA